MDNFILAQIFGVLASAAFIISVQFKQKVKILVALIINTILLVISLALLGAWSGVTTNLVTLLPALYVYYCCEKHRKISPAMALPFLAVLLVAWAFVFSSIYDILALIGSTFYVISLFQKRENTIRQLLIGNQVAWAFYFLVSGLYTSLVFGVCFIISDAVALHRFRHKKHHARALHHWWKHIAPKF
ncbi:MAG: YgjV family protein [Candidatus Nomurabacteria bacterium]|jgi:hypothetical protein|nr:YgjV family protein [Candidatus Nomurabacteria bacterium]